MNDPMEFHGALGQAIVARREKIGYSQDKLGRLIGLGTDYVASVEEGKRDLELSEMVIIARVLRMPLSTLLALAECTMDVE